MGIVSPSLIYRLEQAYRKESQYFFHEKTEVRNRKGGNMERNNYLFFTGDGYDYLEGHLKAIYGERGDFHWNVQRFLAGEVYQARCHRADQLDDLPEITPDQIKGIVAREQHFKDTVNNICEKYDEIIKDKKTLTDDDALYLAGLMGLAPGVCDWMDTLFPNLVDLFVSCEEEAEKIRCAVNDNKKIVHMIVAEMLDGMRGGQIIQVGGRDVFSQGYARNFYRGENAYNKTSKPSMFRKRPANEEEAELQDLISFLAIYDFVLWLKDLYCTTHWPFGHIHAIAIAQHYGIPTFTVDITSDFKVALFFACCKYDWEQQKWRPLQKSEFEQPDSRADVAARGGDSRYGVLFSTPADVEHMSFYSGHKVSNRGMIEPIGYQPFMRCPRQSAYILTANYAYDVFQDSTFAKVKFRHTEELCQWIYDEMDGGAKIYPEEGKMNCEHIAARFRSSKVFSDAAWKLCMEQQKIPEAKAGELKAKLEQRGYSFAEKVEWCTQDELDAINNEWKSLDYLTKNEVTPKFRFGFCI